MDRCIDVSASTLTYGGHRVNMIHVHVYVCLCVVCVCQDRSEGRVEQRNIHLQSYSFGSHNVEQTSTKVL